MILDLKSGRLIVNKLATGEVGLQIDCGRGTMGVVLTEKQVVTLRRRLFECLYPKGD